MQLAIESGSDSSRRSHARLVRVALVVAAIACLPACHRHANTNPCIVSESETRELFDRLVPALRGTDCTFQGLHTNQYRLELTLRSGTESLEPFILAHRACIPNAVPLGARYIVQSPAATTTRCPIATQHIRATIETSPAR